MSKEKFVADTILKMVNIVLKTRIPNITYGIRKRNISYGEDYGISEETKRRALNELVKCGYIKLTASRGYIPDIELIKRLQHLANENVKKFLTNYIEWREGKITYDEYLLAEKIVNI